MESSNSRISDPNTRQSSKRLLFDRRYGWVIDDWKDPSEEALDGGRGMFCIVPLAKAFVQRASQAITLVATSAIKASERPQLPSQVMLQSALDEGVQNFMSSLKNTGLKGFFLNKNPQSHDSDCSSDSNIEGDE